jgi:hypothetical protein
VRGQDIEVIVRYILRVAGEAPFEFLRQRIAQVAPTLEEPMASAAEQLIQQGIQQGVAEGRAQALRGALVRLPRARFGSLDTEVERRIAEAAASYLDRWIERFATAGCIEDVLAE